VSEWVGELVSERVREWIKPTKNGLTEYLTTTGVESLRWFDIQWIAVSVESHNSGQVIVRCPCRTRHAFSNMSSENESLRSSRSSGFTCNKTSFHRMSHDEVCGVRWFVCSGITSSDLFAIGRNYADAGHVQVVFVPVEHQRSRKLSLILNPAFRSP